MQRPLKTTIAPVDMIEKVMTPDVQTISTTDVVFPHLTIETTIPVADDPIHIGEIEEIPTQSVMGGETTGNHPHGICAANSMSIRILMRLVHE